MDEIKKGQGLLISSIRDKMGNEMSFHSGTDPNEELYLRKFNKAGKVIYKGTFKHNLKDGLHLQYDDAEKCINQSYYKDDKPIEMPADIKLYTAVQNGDIHMVKDVITYNPKMVDLTTPTELQPFPASDDKQPFSILELSIKNNQTDIANFLLDSGARTDDYKIKHAFEDKERKHDPLTLGLKNLNNNIIQNILSKNPDILQLHHKELLRTIKDKISLNTTQLTNSLNFVNSTENNKKLKM